MSRFFIKLAALLITAAMLLASPAAAEDKTYLAEFKAYQEAMESGDTTAALSHGYAAWQSAETELGDDRLTAILAYNYGALAIYSDPARANIALIRAKELTDAGLGDLPLDDLELYLAYTAFKLDTTNRRHADSLRAQLEKLQKSQIPPTTDTANMWFELASADIIARQFRLGAKSAASAEEAIAVAYPQRGELRANALILQGIAELVPPDRRIPKVLRAIELFHQAESLFPPQKNIDEFNSTLAQASAWEHAGIAFLFSEGENKNRIPEPIRTAHAFFGDNQDTDTECKIEWEKKPAVWYPQKAYMKGYLGAVLIGYNLTDDLTVHDARILAEVPEGIFGKGVLEELEKARLKSPPPDNPRCRENQLFRTAFILSKH